MYFRGLWNPNDPALLVDVDVDIPCLHRTKSEFLDILLQVAGEDAVVTWDRDVAPFLEHDDAPFSMHQGGSTDALDPAISWIHSGVRVYTKRTAAIYIGKPHNRWHYTRDVGRIIKTAWGGEMVDNVPGSTDLVRMFDRIVGR